MFVSYMYCVLSSIVLGVEADHSYRGVLPNVVCLRVIVNLDNGKTLAH